MPLGAIIGWEFWVFACGALTLTGELQVLPWSSDHTTAWGDPSGFPNGSVRNGVQNWYSRPRCGLFTPLSTTNQFLSSEIAHVARRGHEFGVEILKMNVRERNRLRYFLSSNLQL